MATCYSMFSRKWLHHFISKAPVDRFSLRPDQTPYRALSRKGWPITTSCSADGAESNHLKSEKRFKNLNSHFETCSGPPSKRRRLSSDAVPETQRAIAARPVVSYTPPTQSFSSSDFSEPNADILPVRVRHVEPGSMSTDKGLVESMASLLG